MPASFPWPCPKLQTKRASHLRDGLIVVKVRAHRPCRTALKRVILTSLLGTVLSAQTPSQRKLFSDREHGVTFSYPAAWLLNADDDAATAKLRITLEAQPAAVVQLEGSFTGQGPYRDTDFEAGAFAFVVTASDSAAACFTQFDRIAETAAKPTTRAAGTPAREARFSGMVAGTADLHHALAAFRDGQCLFFETALIRRAPGTVQKPLREAAWTRLAATFDSVLRSVRLSAPAKP